MKQSKLFSILVALLVMAVPATAVFTGLGLDATLSNLRRELYHDYVQIDETRESMEGKYALQHQKMVEIVKLFNDISLMLYSQKQDYTFDISYALEKVTREYNDFNKNRTPYDRIVFSLDVEMNRYARLIESLRRLPPELREVQVVPDSLAYHNDTLDAHLIHNESLLQQELQEQVEAVLASNTAFILSESGQTDRDSCLLYASELLKLYAETRDMVMADSTHYREARLRMDESYEYARDYYGILEKNVFVDGQTPWFSILKNPKEYWKEVRRAMIEKYSFSSLLNWMNDADLDRDAEEMANDNRVSNVAKLYWMFLYAVAFILLWAISALVLLLLCRFVKSIGKRVAPEQKRYIALLMACVFFLIFSYESVEDDIARQGMHIMHTFILLLMAINTALLIRVDASKLKNGVRIYLPTVFMALFVIGCRVVFVPNAFLNFFFPPLLLIMTLWQLLANLLRGSKADQTDTVIGWVSLAVMAVALVVSWAGYVFLALIILVWWYFQLAVILAIATVWDMTLLYKKQRLNKRISAYNAKITYVTGPAKEKLLFRATWFYDFIRDVLIPLLVLFSLPACVSWALNIFEFDNLYRTIFEEHFPSESAAKSVPSVPSVACSTAEALAWDASFKNLNDPSGRAVKSVHENSY